MAKTVLTHDPKCRCGAWADGAIHCNGRRYCVACLGDLEDASRPPLDHAEAMPVPASMKEGTTHGKP
jgi:hypothetical protein